MDLILFREKKPKRSCKTHFFNFLIYLLMFFLSVATLLLSYFLYYSFAALVLLTFHFYLNQWLSLFTKSLYDMFVRMFGNFFEIGILYTLALICVYFVSDYIEIVKLIFTYITKFLALRNYYESTDIEYIKKANKKIIIGYSVALISILTFILLLVYVSKIILSIFAVIVEVAILLFVFVGQLIWLIYKKFHRQPVENDINKENKKVNAKVFKFLKESIFYIMTMRGMFTKSYNKEIRCKCCNPILYKVIIGTIVFGFQAYSVIYPFAVHSITLKHFILITIVRLCCLYKSIAFNVIDMMINPERLIHSIKMKKAKYTLYATLCIFFFSAFIFIAIIRVPLTEQFPYYQSAKYIENNQTWFKLGEGRTFHPEGFCFTKAQKDGSLKLEDFAMLTTLPRLYNLTENGKCYLSPANRGLFNSTMKYIFGRNYEEDGIRIMCKKITNNTMIVITSDKILNQTLSYYSYDNNITFLKKQFDITNTDYFKDHEFVNLTEEGEELLTNYEKCVNKSGTKNCEDEWDSFTQHYWPAYHTVYYEDIPGFERYQINIDSETVIQPQFITGDGQLMAGTHYVVGGGYENRWGMGYFTETIGRKYGPEIIESFLILYSLIRSFNRDIFLFIEWVNRKLFYYDLISLNEMNKISELYGQFNFSHDALYAIGHSISGTSIKVASFFNDIQGTVFEASDGESNINFDDLFTFKKFVTIFSNNFNQITNVYSSNNIASGFDGNCDSNGILPEPRFLFPNVFNTACMAAITCSDTKKYIPFCKQVLVTFYDDKQSDEFDKVFDKFLEFYGY